MINHARFWSGEIGASHFTWGLPKDGASDYDRDGGFDEVLVETNLTVSDIPL